MVGGCRGVWSIKAALVRGAVAATLCVPGSAFALGQEFVLGPAQFKEDTSGHGAVLCAWGFWSGVQQWTAACGLTHTPTDEAIDRGVHAIEAFIIANSSLQPTQAMLDRFKARQEELLERRIQKTGLRKTCDRDDLGSVRNTAPDQFDAGIKNLLATPREPVMNPCL